MMRYLTAYSKLQNTWSDMNKCLSAWDKKQNKKFSVAICSHFSSHSCISAFLSLSLSPLITRCLLYKCRWPFHLSKDYVCNGLLSRSRGVMCICLLAYYSANKLPLWKHLNIKYDRRCNKIRFRVSPDTPTWGPSLSVAPQVYIHTKSSRRLNSTVQL